MSDANQITQWIEQVKHGDSQAANQLWRLYFERLASAVRQRLRGQNRAVSDEEDIALSVFDSFYAAAQQGRFPQLADRDELWRLLLRMSARKVIDKHRRDQRQRRGGDLEIYLLGDDATFPTEAMSAAPSPDMVAMMQEAVEIFFSQLDVGHLRELAVAKLEGYSNAEIAQRLGCSERTIERRLHLIREKIQQQQRTDHECSPTETPDPGA